jgi:hypothetical protein
MKRTDLPKAVKDSSSRDWHHGSTRSEVSHGLRNALDRQRKVPDPSAQQMVHPQICSLHNHYHPLTQTTIIVKDCHNNTLLPTP